MDGDSDETPLGSQRLSAWRWLTIGGYPGRRPPTWDSLAVMTQARLAAGNKNKNENENKVPDAEEDSHRENVQGGRSPHGEEASPRTAADSSNQNDDNSQDGA